MSLGAASGIQGVESGAYSGLNIGYEFESASPTRFAIEAQLGGQTFEFERNNDDLLHIAQMTIGGRVTHYFGSNDRGLFGFAGAQIGVASVELDNDNGQDLESDAVFAAQGSIGLGWAFNEHWRAAAEYRRFYRDACEDNDNGSKILSSGGTDGFGLSFDYVF
jgi:opacity protein-like surface antigen